MGQTFELDAPSRNGHGGETITAYMAELDDMRAQVAGFVDIDPADVLTRISGISGRLAELRASLQRMNTHTSTGLRTKEVDPLRDELDLQFRVWSRKIALMEWELRMSGGGI